MRSNVRVTLTMAAICATTLGVVACAPNASEEPAATDLVIAVDSIYVTNWDPTQGSIVGAFLEGAAVFDSLAAWDPDTATFLPRLAEEITIDDGRQAIRFRLRDDVEFTDGSHWDASAAETYFDALLGGGSYAFGGAIAGYDVDFAATGEYELELRTSKPIYATDFWVLLTTPVLSAASVADPETAMAEPLGSGPYLLDEVVADTEVRLIRNPDYWAPEAYPFDTITLKVLADPIAKLNALKSGQVDAAHLTLEQVEETRASGLAIHEGGGFYAAIYATDPKNSTIPALRDVRVRQAIAMAFDRESITEEIDLGFGIASSQVFVPEQPQYVAGGDDRYAFDLDRARELMADAGYPDGFEVTMPAYAGTAGLQPVVESSLAALGIRVTWETLPDYLSFFEAITSAQYPLVFQPDLANINTLRVLTEDYAGYGRMIAYDEQIAELVQTIKEGTADESRAASEALGETVLENAVIIPFSRPRVFWGSAPGVTVRVNETAGSPVLLDFGRDG